MSRSHAEVAPPPLVLLAAPSNTSHAPQGSRRRQSRSPGEAEQPYPQRDRNNLCAVSVAWKLEALIPLHKARSWTVRRRTLRVAASASKLEVWNRKLRVASVAGKRAKRTGLSLPRASKARLRESLGVCRRTRLSKSRWRVAGVARALRRLCSRERRSQSLLRCEHAWSKPDLACTMPRSLPTPRR